MAVLLWLLSAFASVCQNARGGCVDLLEAGFILFRVVNEFCGKLNLFQSLTCTLLRCRFSRLDNTLYLIR